MLLGEMVGFDERDSTSLTADQGNVREDFTRALNAPLAGLRIGVPKEYFGDGLAADVEQAVRAALDEFVRMGAILVDISLPKTALSIPVYYIIAPAEASSNLSRFDGVRYGHRASEYKDLADMYKKSRAEGFGREVQRRIMVGTYVLCHGYYDAYYLQAQKIRRLIADDFQAALGDKCDVIMGPVAPTVAWDLGDKANDPVANYLADIFTLSTSLAGLPGMSIPCGFGQGPKNGRRPVGLQIIGNYFAEAKLLGIAHQYQQVTDWHTRSPEDI
jgi:aspartyl-tRNA(Asn)/glutamyl-tRNA(Gln) amidotransferase subunit A